MDLNTLQSNQSNPNPETSYFNQNPLVQTCFSQIKCSNIKVNELKKLAVHKKDNKKHKSLKKVFTVEEDNRLIELHSIYKDNWKKISDLMPKRTIRQCKERYFHYLSPDISQSQWTEDEDELLIKKVNLFGKKWKSFENFFKGRIEISIRNRWNMLERKQKRQIKKQLQNRQKIYEQYIINQYRVIKNSNRNKKINNNIISAAEAVPEILELPNPYQKEIQQSKMQANNDDIEKNYPNNPSFIDLTVNKIFDFDVNFENEYIGFF